MRLLRRRSLTGHAVLITLTLGLGLAACSTFDGGNKSVTPMRVDAGHAASLISAYRAENGLGPVRVNSQLVAAASKHSRAMGTRDKIDHRIGGSLAKRVTAAGYRWGAVAENLAAGYSSVDDAMAGWKRSSGHRRNLLNPYATEIGIAAVATSSDARYPNYWTLILAMPQPDRVAAGPFGLELAR